MNNNDSYDKTNIKKTIKSLDNKIKELEIEEKIMQNNDLLNNLYDNDITIKTREYQRLQWCENYYNRVHLNDFFIKINYGEILPYLHPDYGKNRFFLLLYDFNNYSIQINEKKYIIKSQVLFNKIKSYVIDNLNTLIDISKKETNNYLINNIIDSSFKKEVSIKYGKLFIELNAQVKGEISTKIDKFVNELKEIIVNEAELDDKDYIINSLKNNIDYNTNNKDDKYNQIIDLLVKKIESLKDGSRFRILDLINVNKISENKNINLTRITVRTLRKLEEKGYNIKSEKSGFIGVPEGLYYIKEGKIK